MKNFQTIVALVLVLTFSACGNSTTENKNIGASELQETLSVFNDAFKAGDLTALDSLTAENYIHTNGSSKAFDKASWFAYLEKRTAQLKSGELEVLTYELNDTIIRMHDNLAIVTGRITVVVKDTAQTKESQFRITNIWVKEAEGWRRAGFHDGRIE